MISNKLSVVYGFDIDSELKYFELSLKSLINSNGTKYTVHTFVKNENLKIEVEKIYLKFNVETKFKIHLLDDIGSFRKQGKFYWLRSPFKVNSKYILQLDNDTLINTDLNKVIINSKKSGKFPIYGVKVKTPENYLKSLNEIMNDNKNLEDTMWLNAGIILINKKLYKKHFKKELYLIEALKKYSSTSIETKEKIQSDEIFIVKEFGDKLGKIARRYNLRFQSPITTSKWILKNDYIFHYNLRNKLNNKFTKYNFDNFLFEDKNIENEVKRIYNTIEIILDFQNDKIVKDKSFFENDLNDYINKVLKELQNFL